MNLNQPNRGYKRVSASITRGREAMRHFGEANPLGKFLWWYGRTVKKGYSRGSSWKEYLKGEVLAILPFVAWVLLSISATSQDITGTVLSKSSTVEPDRGSKNRFWASGFVKTDRGDFKLFNIAEKFNENNKLVPYDSYSQSKLDKFNSLEKNDRVRIKQSNPLWPFPLTSTISFGPAP